MTNIKEQLFRTVYVDKSEDIINELILLGWSVVNFQTSGSSRLCILLERDHIIEKNIKTSDTDSESYTDINFEHSTINM